MRPLKVAPLDLSFFVETSRAGTQKMRKIALNLTYFMPFFANMNDFWRENAEN